MDRNRETEIPKMTRNRRAGCSLSALLVVLVALPAFAAQRGPEASAVQSALAQLRQSAVQRPLAQSSLDKLDARLQMLIAPREFRLEAEDAQDLVDGAESGRGSHPALSLDGRKLAKARRLGVAQLDGGQASGPGVEPFLTFQSIDGEPALAVQVESDRPMALGDVAQSLSGRLEGEAYPEGPTTLVIPVSRLRSLIDNPEVTRVRLPVRYEPVMDAALADTGTTSVHNSWNLRGSGAVYAAIDTGVDWNHPDFKNPDGTTRILYIWDQTASGTPPAGYTYGAEWTSSQINAGICTEADSDTSTWGHGTSTTGVGAGNGTSTGGTFDGQADRADIILVKSDLSDAHIEDGLAYIKAKAASLGRPVSINMSFSSGWGPHDGGDDLSYWIDHSLGVSDSSTGISMSAAAGNDTGNHMHVDGAICAMSNINGNSITDATNVQAFSYNWNGAGYAGQPMFMEFYLPATANVQVRAWVPVRFLGIWTYASWGWIDVSSANSGYYAWTRQTWLNSFVGDPTTSSTSGSFGVYLNFQKPMTDYHNGNLQYVYVAYDYATTSESSYGGDLYYVPSGWSGPMPIIIQFRQDGGTGSGAHIDGYLPSWTYGDYATATEDCTNRYLGGDDAKMISGPAAAHSVMAVGAHVTKTAWTDKSGASQSTSEALGALASYSSHGPLRGISEGNAVVTDQKPNLTAPGETVVTSLSSQLGASFYTYNGQAPSTHIVQETPANMHIAESGTSFSSPQVAGAAAILMGAQPTLTLGQIRSYLQTGARSDASTGVTPNSLWGYGKLTLDNSLVLFANLVYRGTVASSLSPLQGAAGNTYTDAGALSVPGVYFYSVNGAGNTLRLSKSGSDAVLTW